MQGNNLQHSNTVPRERERGVEREGGGERARERGGRRERRETEERERGRERHTQAHAYMNRQPR